MGVRHRELREARSVEEVLRITREYLREVGLAAEAIPPECWPAPLRGPADIELWADRLDHASESQCTLTDEVNALDRLASHFLIASLRVRELLRPALAAAPGELRAAA
jgi:hypothetical protein